MSFNGIHETVHIPQFIKDHILQVGGENPHGQPMFRLIFAQDRYMQASGEWAIWPMTTPANERGAIIHDEQMRMIEEASKMADSGQQKIALKELEQIALDTKPSAPQSVVIGRHEYRKYTALHGFVIEKWRPPSHYGPRSTWEAVQFRGEAALGPYPERGDYEMIAGPADRMPSLTVIEEAIRKHFRDLEDQNPDPKQRVLEHIIQLQEAADRLHQDQLSIITAKLKDSEFGLRNRLSLGAGRVMNKLAEQTGHRSHFGN